MDLLSIATWAVKETSSMAGQRAFAFLSCLSCHLMYNCHPRCDDLLILLVLWQLVVLQLVLQPISCKLHDSKETLSDKLRAGAAITFCAMDS